MPAVPTAKGIGRISHSPIAPNGDNILLVGNSGSLREAAEILEEESWAAVTLPSLDRAGADRQLAGVSVVLLDGAPRTEPIETLLDLIAEVAPFTATIMITEHDRPTREFRRLRAHWPRIVAAPVKRQTLLSALDAALLYRNLLTENRILRDELRAATRLEDWIGYSSDSASIRSAIITAAFSTSPVLIVGEDGTGRRLVAELIHRLGQRSALAFLPFRVGALPTGELGAVLSALRRATAAPGLSLRQALPGSIYLSDIEALSRPDRAVLEDALRRPPAFRLLLSAGTGFLAQTSERRFASPKLKRLGAFAIRLTPLRERREDIPALTLHFLAQACRESGVGPYGISSTMMDAYTAWNWPGNTAELRTHIHRAVATAAVSRFDGPVLPDSICSLPEGPTPLPSLRDARPLKAILQDVEKGIIRRAMSRSQGNQKQAAALLQVNPTTLHEKLKRYGMLRRLRRYAPRGQKTA